MRRWNYHTRLAWTGIRNNRQFYLPYLFTCVGMVMMYYIIAYLAHSPLLLQMQGGETMATVMALGQGVMGVFSLIFLFYTNSFRMRRRNKEFGLYSILGMNKGNISRILLWETLFTGAAALVAGLGLGVLFSKLAELCLLRMMKLGVTYSLSLPWHAVGQTAGLFAAIFLLLTFFSLGRLRLASPLALLGSEQSGERPPKANWLLAVAGAALLAGAYWLAVSIQEPLTAILWFFVAVVMVIVATYLLFVAGSVAWCRFLQWDRRYYYRADHFVAVSSMAFRMRRNGAGLASICILSTMVLVTLSSTSCLMIGSEDSLAQQYPRDCVIRIYCQSAEECSDQRVDQLRDLVKEQTQGKAENTLCMRIGEMTGVLEENGNLNFYLDHNVMPSYDRLRQVYLIPLSDYNRMTGQHITLQPGEALAYAQGQELPGDTLSLGDGSTLHLRQMKEFPQEFLSQIPVSTYYLALPDFTRQVEPLMGRKNNMGADILNLLCAYSFDLAGEESIRDVPVSAEGMRKLYGEDASFTMQSLAAARENFYSLYGSLFFLGVLLSGVFLFAAVLIIYYKQVSEGFEDRARFELLQKVGMTRTEIRRSIKTQVRTVFFAPLILAGLHQAFAFPLVWKILQLLSVTNLRLLLVVNGGCLLVFAVLYVTVYQLTSHVFYGIVSGEGEGR